MSATSPRKSNTVHERVVLPLGIPLGVIVVTLLLVFSISRILIALHDVAVSVAIAGSAGILMIAALLDVLPTRRDRLVPLFAIAAVTVVGGGFYAATLGDVDSLLGAHAAEDEGHPQLRVIAEDVDFPSEVSTGAGEVDITLVNAGRVPHTFVFDDVEGFKLEVNAEGDADAGQVELEPGSYTFYCDVPGHRAAGMEGVLNVE